MKIIPLLPFFDLYAGTYNQQELYKAICEVRNERSAIDILNRMTPHLLRVTTPAGSVVSNDTVLTRLRSNTVDVDLILDSTGIGDLGYSSCWSGEGYAIAFKQREDGAEKYYDPEPATGNDIVLKINLNDVFDHEAEGHGAGARATLCAIVQHARGSQEWPVTEASMVNTLANISDRFETLRRHHKGHHATLVIEMPAVEDGIAKWSVTLGDPKPDYTFDPRSYHEPRLNQQPHMNPWATLNGRDLATILEHYVLTQVTHFPPGVNPSTVPQGMELMKLVREYLTANLSQPFGYGHGHRPGSFSSGAFFGHGWQQGFGHTRDSYGLATMASEALKMSTEVTIPLGDDNNVFLEPIALHFRNSGVINQNNFAQENLALSLRFNDIRVLLMQAARNNPGLLNSAVKNLVYVQRPKHELTGVLKQYAGVEYAGWMLVGRSDVAESDPMFVIPGCMAGMYNSTHPMY